VTELNKGKVYIKGETESQKLIWSDSATDKVSFSLSPEKEAAFRSMRL
jgi:hypothetical protein